MSGKVNRRKGNGRGERKKGKKNEMKAWRGHERGKRVCQGKGRGES